MIETVFFTIMGQKANNFRSKRVLTNLMGCLANVLFGVCNDADAEYFYSKIREVNNFKERTSQAIETQT